MNIFPAIDLLGGRCVRLRQGDYAQSTVYSDDPADTARRWVSQGADRLHVVDLDGAKAGRPVNVAAVRAIVEACPGMPVQLGGGVRTADDIATAFDLGVRWVVLGTRALHDPAFVRQAAEAAPGRVVLGLDAKDGFVATAGWLDVSAVRAVDLARLVADAPLAAVVYTDIATDGMMAGPNYPALAELRAAVSLPVTASGGIATLAHVRRLAELGVPACIIGRALYDGAITLPDALAAAC